jgi:hypothetical protein
MTSFFDTNRINRNDVLMLEQQPPASDLFGILFAKKVCCNYPSCVSGKVHDHVNCSVCNKLCKNCKAKKFVGKRESREDATRLIKEKLPPNRRKSKRKCRERKCRERMEAKKLLTQ